MLTTASSFGLLVAVDGRYQRSGEAQRPKPSVQRELRFTRGAHEELAESLRARSPMSLAVSRGDVHTGADEGEGYAHSRKPGVRVDQAAGLVRGVREQGDDRHEQHRHDQRVLPLVQPRQHRAAAPLQAQTPGRLVQPTVGRVALTGLAGGRCAERPGGQDGH